jgi:hypothetical protein
MATHHTAAAGSSSSSSKTFNITPMGINLRTPSAGPELLGPLVIAITALCLPRRCSPHTHMKRSMCNGRNFGILFSACNSTLQQNKAMAGAPPRRESRQQSSSYQQQQQPPYQSRPRDQPSYGHQTAQRGGSNGGGASSFSLGHIGQHQGANGYHTTSGDASSMQSSSRTGSRESSFADAGSRAMEKTGSYSALPSAQDAEYGSYAPAHGFGSSPASSVGGLLNWGGADAPSPTDAFYRRSRGEAGNVVSSTGRRLSYGSGNSNSAYSTSSGAYGASAATAAPVYRKSSAGSSQARAHPAEYGGGGHWQQQSQQQQQQQRSQQRSKAAHAVSSNMYATGSNQNCGNMITDRPTSRVLAPPGGFSTFSLG